MKLISLNIWGGKYFEPLIKFVKDNSTTTDIFCFQEIYDTSSTVKQYLPKFLKTGIERISNNHDSIRANLLDELKNILKDFTYFYFPTLKGYDDVPNKVNFDLSYGQAMFVKTDVKINSHKDYFIYRDKSLNKVNRDFSNLATPLQYIRFTLDDKQFTLFHFHGTSYPPNKLDSKNRLIEARKVRKIMDSIDGAKILVGDFNLLPETKSIKIFEENMINLIKRYNIKMARSKLTPYYGTDKFQPFADYFLYQMMF